MWDEASLKQSPPDREYSGATSAVAFSRDGSHLAAGMITVDEKGTRDYVEYQGLLKLWDTAIGKLAWKRVLPDGELSALAFSPDGNTLATGHDGVLVKLFDAKTSNRMHFFTDKDAVIQDPMQMVGDPVVLSLAFSSDGKMLASGGSNGHLYVWDTQTAKQLAHLSEPHFEGELAKMYEIGSQTGTERSAATHQSVRRSYSRLTARGCTPQDAKAQLRSGTRPFGSSSRHYLPPRAAAFGRWRSVPTGNGSSRRARMVRFSFGMPQATGHLPDC